MKLNAFSFAIVAILAATACSDRKPNNSEIDTQSTTDVGARGSGEGAVKSDSSQIYVCPRHPEVQHSTADTCPFCGMKMVVVNTPATAQAWSFAFNPERPNPGQPVQMTIRPVKHKASPEEETHLIFTAKDLSYFDHVLLETGANEPYKVEHTFPSEDEYILYVSCKTPDGNQTTDKQSLEVGNGKSRETEYPEQILKKDVDGYRVELTKTDGKRFKVGKQAHIRAVISKNGKAIAPTQLEECFGGKAYLGILRQYPLEYLPVSPLIETEHLDWQTAFDRAGTYRAWLQFQTEGKMHTADFVILVQ